MRETDCRSADGRMARILFIDDDEQTGDLFGQILEGAGHEVIIARDGVTGIALYRKNPTDLIITEDRKSTRLNSSHGYISYAVFCLKKKKQTTHHIPEHER